MNTLTSLVRRFTLASIASLAMAASLTACGGGGAVGEGCDASGEDGQCEDGAVCGKPGDVDALECLVACTAQEDCAADEECNGVEGSSVKGCRSKDGGK